MTLKFDEYYSYPQLKRQEFYSGMSSSSSERNSSTLFPGWGNRQHGHGRKLEAATMPKMTYMGRQGWNPKTRAWTLWTLRDPLIQESWNMRVTAKNGNRKIWIGIPKSGFLDTIYRSSAKLCQAFPQLPLDSIVLMGHCEQAYRSDGILNYGETFVYSSLSDTITIDAAEVGFEVDGKRENKMAEGIVKLKGCGGLAQILAACIKRDDIFVIVGRQMDVSMGDSQVMLNSLRGQDQPDVEPLVIIRISHEVMDQNVRLMERISHHVTPGYFAFEYSCLDLGSGYSVDLRRFRTFSWKEGPERAQNHYNVVPVPKDALDNFDMPITREAIVVHVYSYLLAQKFNRASRQQRRRSSSTSSSNNVSSPSGSSSGYTTEVYDSPASVNALSPVFPQSNFERYVSNNSRAAQGQRKVRFSDQISHHFSTDEEDEGISDHAGYGSSSSNAGSWIPSKRSRRIGVKLLKLFCSVCCPVIVLIIFAMSFNPNQPECICDPFQGATTTERNEYSSYNTYNYEDITY